MSETSSPKTKRKTTADYKAALAEIWAEINRLNEQMRQDQADIDRLKLETDALKLETDAIKLETGELKAEALRLKLETRAILARLGAAF